jgi:hypothetical protein
MLIQDEEVYHRFHFPILLWYKKRAGIETWSKRRVHKFHSTFLQKSVNLFLKQEIPVCVPGHCHVRGTYDNGGRL